MLISGLVREEVKSVFLKEVIWNEERDDIGESRHIICVINYDS